MISPERQQELLFPHDEVREEQNKLLLLTDATIKSKRNLIVHAPTGLGKTAAALSPALSQAIENDYTVLFLTSRHTQHKIALETLKQIKDKYNVKFNSASIIGKKWMCLQPGVESLFSSDFADYCKNLRENNKCEFYTNARKNVNNFTLEAKNLVEEIGKQGPSTTEKVKDFSEEKKMCPYEISLGLAKKAEVIVTDYYYLFHPGIGENFLAKIQRELGKLIVIVDEAHNLPYRLKDLASEYLSSAMVRRAIKEAKKFGYENTIQLLQEINDLLNNLSKNMNVNDEKMVSKNDIYKPLDKAYDFDQIIGDLEFVGEAIREVQKNSYIGSIARFLEAWQGQDEGYARILSMKRGAREPYVTLSYRCLDPSVVCKDIINNAHSTILMSGTLLPTSMYRELLGIENAQEVVFKDPFPKDNRLNLIVPKTTTKYTARSEEQFQDIAGVLANTVNEIPGNSAIFFPSYALRDKVLKFFETQTEKTVFTEKPGLNKYQRHQLLDNFKSYKDSGAVLMAVASGSFGEGIDLPGDFLKAVIMVGLPLTAPDLETKSLIEYYDKKFNKGWDYGYLFPAFNKTLQNAGRCIRSETDKGLIMFLDKRYTWRNYYRCFPEDWELTVSRNHVGLIKEFFSQ